MRRSAAVFFALLAMAPASAWAEEAGTGDKAFDMVLDLAVLRPLGLVATGVGSVVFVVALPFTLPTGQTGAAACQLVQAPLAYTFTRPLGQVEGQADACGDVSPRSDGAP